MKRSAFICLLLLSFHCLIYYLSLDFQILGSKLEAACLRSQKKVCMNLVVVRARNGNLVDNEENELYVDGRLYDIAQTRVTSDSVYYYGVEDTNEEIAMNELAAHYHSGDFLSNSTSVKRPHLFVSLPRLDMVYLISSLKLCSPQHAFITFTNGAARCLTGYKNVRPYPPNSLSATSSI